MAAKLRVGSIVTDCVEFDRMLSFWQEALGYAPKYPPGQGWAILRDLHGTGPNLSLNRVRRNFFFIYKVNIEIYTQDREREVDRLVGIGAKRHRQRYGPDDDFRVLEDPDGNLFCVVQLPRETN